MAGTRRRLTSAIVAAALAIGILGATAGAAGAQATPTAPQLGRCGAAAYRMLYWPSGHKKIASAKLAAASTPHVELYKGTGKSYPDSALVAYADATGQAKLTGCQTASLPPNPVVLPKASPVAKPTLLTCTFAAEPVVIASVSTTGSTAIILFDASGKQAVTESMLPTGSSLIYDQTACKPGKVPT